jgi:predicted PurR-regulated permease PerM
VAGTRTNRTLLRALVWAVLFAFALLLTYRFLATVTTVALSLVTGVLLAVVLSGPVELLHRHKIPRPLALALIVAGILGLLGVGGLLLLPTLSEEASRFASSLPRALSDVGGRVRQLAQRFGVPIAKGSFSSSSLGERYARRWVVPWTSSAARPPC